MNWFRRPQQPQQPRYIQETIVYIDYKMADRISVVQDWMNGKEVSEDDPRLEAFKDPYWTGEAYRQRYDGNPTIEPGLEGRTYAPPGEDPIHETDKYFRQMVADSDEWFRDANRVFEEMEEFFRDLNRPFEELEAMARGQQYTTSDYVSPDMNVDMNTEIPNVDLGMPIPDVDMNYAIPPHARILHYGVRVGYDLG